MKITLVSCYFAVLLCVFGMTCRQPNGTLLSLQEHPLSQQLPNMKIYAQKDSYVLESEERIYNGLDLFEKNEFYLLHNKRFALFTNNSAKNSNQEHILDILMEQTLVPQFITTPEHGLFGAIDTSNLNISVKQTLVDPRYKIPIFSLYGDDRKIAKSLWDSIDVMVIDIFNLPIRCYTYTTSIYELLEQAHNHAKQILILDRVNPYQQLQANGSNLDPNFRSFIGAVSVPFFYNLTNAELAIFSVVTDFPKLKLDIIKGVNFSQSKNLHAVWKPWINPSPNIPNYEAALVYIGMVLFEGVEFSVGRGTTRPFVYSGAPWITEPWRLVTQLRDLQLPAVQFATISFTPNFSKYSGTINHGIQIIPDLKNSQKYVPLRVAYEYMRLLYHNYRKQFVFVGNKTNGYLIDRLWGSDSWRKSIIDNVDYINFAKSLQNDLDQFQKQRKLIRLYQ